MKLLIVEDNPEMRRLLAGTLKHLAEQIYECTDGAEAVAAYQASDPDWVLMDIKMKRVDGIVATRLIKERWPASQMPGRQVYFHQPPPDEKHPDAIYKEEQ